MTSIALLAASAVTGNVCALRDFASSRASASGGLMSVPGVLVRWLAVVELVGR
jgi:hypothetical protein